MKQLLLFFLVSISYNSLAWYADSLLEVYSSDVEDGYTERILEYHSDITINKDRAVRVHEYIVVNAQLSSIKRGIYRDLPLSYEWGLNRYNVKFDLVDIKRDGHKEPHFTEWMSNGIRIYIGKEDVFISSGIHVYEIVYDVKYVIGLFDTYDELAWNVNGNGWEFTIDKVSATIHLPEGATITNYAGYTGYYGSKGKNFEVDKNNSSISFTSTSKLHGQECLTVSVAWDKNHISYPTFWEKLTYILWCYAVWFVCIGFILLGFLFNFIAWWKYGRDPKPGTIIPRFYPPNGLSPAECAYLENDGRRTDTMIGSMILILATKGWIEIDRLGKNSFKLTTTGKDVQRKELNDIETSFYEKLMKQETLFISEGTYNSRLASSGTLLETRIDRKQDKIYYKRNQHLKSSQYVFPALTVGLGFLTKYFVGGPIWVPIVIGVVHVILNVVFSKLYEQPTKEGRRVLDEIAGFKMYMKYANKERINLMNPPTMDFSHFEENLAYAVALGVADSWAGQFDQKVIEEANTGGMPYMHGFMFARYSSFSTFGSEISSSISSASIPPSTSGSGGGFSDGGGFSGGGFGGGGGGGW